MIDDLWVQRRFSELKVAFIFLTRLPVGHRIAIAKGELALALWSGPIVGAVVGLIGGLVYTLGALLHLPPLPAAALAVAATILVTGAIHEDGLADIADGFGGGTSREGKLEIMRDSRIGTYGVCALALSLILRVAALTNLGEPAPVLFALIAAHAAGRGGMPALMWLVPPARPDGLSADAGEPPRDVALAAALLGALALLIGLGAAGLIALVLVAVGTSFIGWLSMRQIGGQTGDVVGAAEQVGEIAVLLVAAAAR